MKLRILISNDISNSYDGLNLPEISIEPSRTFSQMNSYVFGLSIVTVQYNKKSAFNLELNGKIYYCYEYDEVNDIDFNLVIYICLLLVVVPQAIDSNSLFQVTLMFNFRMSSNMALLLTLTSTSDIHLNLSLTYPLTLISSL